MGARSRRSCACLTPTERRNLATTLRRLTEDGLAVALIDHDIAFIRRVADRVVALDAGRIIGTGTPDGVLTDPTFVAAYLGSAEVPV